MGSGFLTAMANGLTAAPSLRNPPASSLSLYPEGDQGRRSTALSKQFFGKRGKPVKKLRFGLRARPSQSPPGFFLAGHQGCTVSVI